MPRTGFTDNPYKESPVDEKIELLGALASHSSGSYIEGATSPLRLYSKSPNSKGKKSPLRAEKLASVGQPSPIQAYEKKKRAEETKLKNLQQQKELSVRDFRTMEQPAKT